MAGSETKLFYGGSEGLQKLWQQKDFADVEVKCANKAYKVHKLVLQLQGGFFAKAVTNKKFVEANSGIITINEADRDVIEGVLRHLYDLPYTDSMPHGYALAAYHAKIYSAGEFYELPKLKASALSHITPLMLSDQKIPYNTYVNVAKEAQNGTPSSDRDLRDLVVSATGNYAKGLLNRWPSMASLLEKNHGFATDIACQYLKDKSGMKSVTCQGCDTRYGLPFDIKTWSETYCGYVVCMRCGETTYPVDD